MITILAMPWKAQQVLINKYPGQPRGLQQSGKVTLSAAALQNKMTLAFFAVHL